MAANVSTFSNILLDGLKGVLIDIDDTLYSYDPCHQFALESVFAHETLGLEKEDFFYRYRQARDSVTMRLNGQGACRSRLFAFLYMIETLKLSSAYVKAYQLDQIYWDKFIEYMEMDDNAFGFLMRCNQNQIPICAVSDMTAHIQIRKLQKLKLTSLINFLVTSEEVGIEKPDALMFRAGLEKLKAEPSQVIMIGDSFKKDVEGACKLGIKAYHIDLSRKD